MATNGNSPFQARARFEAERYGSDAWVFIRELLQNARDAGAGRVWLDVASEHGRDRVLCRDDGGGMTFAHARDYLFTLYASNKRGGAQSAGRFGIGFWSILRFEPVVITIRSRTADSGGWQVRLDHELEVVGHEAVRMQPGTEIVIEREASGDDIESLVRAAVLRDAPFLTRRGRGGGPLTVLVNGGAVRADFDLPPPSMTFRRRGIRGVVGLGSVSKVEIFVHGLRVRDAASFDDLLLTGRRGRSALPAVTGELVPQAMVDSSSLTVLLARGDTREDRSLRRLVAVGHRELRRLVRAELDRHSRPSPVAWVVERARAAWVASRPWRGVCLGVLLALAGYVGVRVAFDGPAGRRGPGPEASIGVPRSAAPDGPLPYSDIGDRYKGPDADALGGPSPAVDLSYRPGRERRFFAALLIVGIDAAGAPVYPKEAAVQPATNTPCTDDCLDVELAVTTASGVLRLPVATGHVVDPASVRLNGEPLAMVEDRGGLPAVKIGDLRDGRLSYRSGVGRGVPGPVGGRWPPLPGELSGPVAEIASLPVDARAGAAADLVRERIVYDASAATAERHRRERSPGRGLFDRSLAVGAGDCDVQNAMVAAILEAVGVPARLAVGWVGESGRATPGLHAWVEVLGSDGRWRVVDASVEADGAGRSLDVRRALQPREGGLHGFDPAAVSGALAAVLLIAVAVLIGFGGGHRSFSLGGRPDIAALVRAAVVHPEAFAGMHALFTRRVVPVLGGSAISIGTARATSARGRLAVGRGECELAARAAERGTVIDGGTAEGAAVAGALGAVDFDAWQQLLERSSRDPVATRVGELLTRAGEPCRLRIARGAGEEIAVLDGFRLGLSREERWVVLDQSGEAWRDARDLARSHPSAAALLLADSVSDRLGLPQARRSVLLAGLARAALEEQAGSAP